MTRWCTPAIGLRQAGAPLCCAHRAAAVSLTEPPPELTELRRIIEAAGARLQAMVVCEVAHGSQRLPVHAIALGSASPSAPAVGFFGGVHGLERIGTQVVIAYLESLVARLQWDVVLQTQLQHLRLVFMPLVNPGGMARGTRANPRGVDLMRNAPVEADEPVPLLLGGHRIGPTLPWYRGAPHDAMQIESAALCEVVTRELLGRPLSIAVDCHSGFGLLDRIWFPFAHTRRPIEHLAEVHAFTTLLDQSCPHHRYRVEPQSRQYRTHGDLWDHLYLRSLQHRPPVFLPLTLEMGSWLWIKKNPRQLLSRQGLFNPSITHRRQRVLRRHLAWFDFVTRAASSFGAWLPSGAAREAEHRQALVRWYGAEPASASGPPTAPTARGRG